MRAKPCVLTSFQNFAAFPSAYLDTPCDLSVDAPIIRDSLGHCILFAPC